MKALIQKIKSQSRYLIVIFLLFLEIGVAKCFVDSLGNVLQISLITCDPGDGIDMLFGHSAIRVKDEVNDVVYNYGTFDFNTPGFTLKFMRGKLPYVLARNNFADFLRVYHYESRTVKEQILNLNYQEMLKYIAFLENNALPENALYKYDFFFDNCSTRIRDGLEGVTDGLVYPKYNTTITFRNILHQYLNGSLWTKHGIDIIIGSLADKTADVSQQMFIPDYLHDHYANTNLKNQPLAFKSKDLINFSLEANNRKVSGWLTPTLIYLFLIGLWLLLTFSKKYTLLKKLTNIVYFLVGIAGLLITFLWFGTDHIATKYNWNLLWLNPLALLLISKFRINVKWLKLGLMTITACLLVLMIMNIVPQYHPSWSLGLFITLVYGIDIYYLKEKLTIA